MKLLQCLFSFLLLLALVLFSCSGDKQNNTIEESISKLTVHKGPFIVVLGTAQDGGYPQSGCLKECCKKGWNKQQTKKLVSCIALIDPVSHEKWMFDATPDFREQLHLLQEIDTANRSLTGIFLTHGHIGHYTGLINLGREVMGASGINVYAMPRMQEFLTNNGPWSQLVTLKNIRMQPINDSVKVQLNKSISVTPFLVPHRDEYTETVGYKIQGPNKTVVFIPDIDKWQKWNQNISELIKQVNYAFIDGTFFKNGELDRDMSQISHPFVSESMKLFEALSKEDRSKIYFIHFNHTNPLLIDESKEQIQLKEAGFNIAKESEQIEL